ncbi:hypothetical protein [Leptothoe spongobia]|uniref:Uncharacterized protein n=1 Tax=Leptothoe spongobia TAU-MAC 1115 TaxID=1967444 RepID=A0A947DDR7_9CYAN|nr:hypothetical protein [Leptothoe spongobia]MBT9315121.1 hypothetical protein [Leptothoe spongobia TAU-MAC 1115]
MASPNITKLPAVPWPTLAGASLLMHGIALSFGLPRMIQVSNPPPPASVDIPVTLVDDAAAPAAPVPVTAGAVTATPSVNPSNTEPETPTSIGGQNADVKPLEQQVERSQSPTQKPPVSSDSDRPEQPISKPENINKPSRETIPDQQPPAANQPAIDSGVPASDESGGHSENASPGPTQVSVIDDVQLPKDSGGDQIDQYPIPIFQMPITFDIPSNHACQGSLSRDVINLGVVVDADGLVSSFRRLQPDIYAQDSDLTLADCLFSTALVDPNVLRFTPAIRLTNIGEEEAVATDRLQLRLRFSRS